MIRSCVNVLLLGAVSLIAGGCELHAESIAAEGSFERSLHVDGPLDLDVLSRSGHIRVQTGSGQTVTVRARIRAYGSMVLFHPYSPAEQVQRLESNPPVEQHGNTIRIGYIDEEALASNVSISYDLTVPAATRLRTSSRSGDQTIDAIDGPVTASSRSGRINITNVVNALDIDTRSGDVDVRSRAKDVKVVSRSGHVALEGEPSQSWTVQTRSGDVEVEAANAEVDVDSRSGSVRSDRPVQIQGGQSRHQLQGVIGKGGAHLQVTTRSGSVRIR